MKKELLKSFTMIILLILVFNNLSVIANALVKIEKTGYKIHVEYNNTGANLFGDTTQVPNNILLKSIKDELENEYDPYNFQKHIKEDGKYKYLLIWENINEKKTYEEEFIISIEKQSFLENITNNTSEYTLKNQELLESRSLKSLQNAPSSEQISFNLNTYSSETSWSLNKEVSFKGGYFIDDDTFINAFDDRIFETAYIIHEGSKEKIEISALFIVNENGKTYKYYVNKKESNNEPTVAYKLKDTDKIYAYFKLKNTNDYQKITNNIPAEWSPSISPNQLDKILVGSKVIVTYTPTSNYINPNVTISTNGKDIKITEEKTNNTSAKTFSFIMPSTPVTINYTGNKQALERKVGLQLGMDSLFQPHDIGFGTLWMEPNHYNTTPIYKNFSTKERFSNSYTFGTEHSRSENWDNSEIKYIMFNDYNQSPNTNYNDGTSDLIPSDQMIKGSVYTGSSSTNTSKHNGHALASFEQGATLEFNLVGSRAKWSIDLNSYSVNGIEYRYIPQSSFQIKIFPDSNTIETDKYTLLTIPLFQDKESYDNQIKNGEIDISEASIINGTNIADKNGLYPVATKLANGMEIICYQKSYDENANPKNFKDAKEPAGKYDFIIKVKNAVDSFLISSGFIAESQQWYQTKTNLNAFETDINGAILEAFNFKDTNKYQRIKDGQALVLGNNQHYDFRMKIKTGYSYPYIYITDYKNKILPNTLRNTDIVNPTTSQEIGRWWINFKSGGNKLISDTLNKDGQTDGYYHIRTNAILGYPHGPYPLYIKSVPIQFSYDFKENSDGTGKNISSGTNINVESNKYFNIPYILPSNETGKQYFQGWELKVTLGNGNNIEIKNIDGKYFNPGDLIDITYIAKILEENFSIDDVGKETYNLNFTPIYTSIASNAKYKIGKWERKYQNSYTGMSEDTGKSVNVLPNELLYMTYQSEVINPNNLSGKYLLGLDSKVKGKLLNDNEVFAKFNYYKGLTVNYNMNLPEGVTANQITDNNFYISQALTKSNDAPNLDEISHIIKLKKVTIANNPNNVQFLGWQLVDSKGDPLNVSMYSADGSIDLTKIDDQSAQNDIFTTGKVNLKAVWGTLVNVKIKHADDSNASTKQAYQVAYEGENLVLTADFKYVNSDNSKANVSLKDIQGNIKYALLKKNPEDTKYQVWLTETGAYGNGVDTQKNNLSKIESYSLEDTGNQTFRIKISIKKEYLSADLDNGAEYRIVAYTSSNNGMESIASNTLGENGILANGDPNFATYELPIVSTYIYYGSVNDIIKYPKEIIMFEDSDGNLDTGVEQIKLMSYPIDNKYTPKLPDINREFKVMVSKNKVLMTNSTNNKDTFEANIIKGNGSNLNNLILGSLQYSNLNGTVVSNVIEFCLKYENINNRKFYDGEIFTGKLTFIFEKM